MALFTWPPQSAGTVTIAAVGNNGTSAPGASIEVGAINPSGNLQGLKTDAAGDLLVKRPDVAFSGTLTSGASSVLFDSSNITEAAIVIAGTFVGTIQPQGSADGSTWSPLPTQLTGGGQLWTSAGITAAGEYKISGTAGYPQVRLVFSAYTSGSVTITGNASGVTTIMAVRQPTAGNLNATVVQGAAGATAWKVDGSGVTQPVSALSLPLPTGASTAALQTSGAQKTQIVDGSGNVIGSTSNALNVQATGSVSVTNFPSSQNVAVTNFPATQTVQVVGSQLGQLAAASSVSVALANEDVQDFFVTGQSAQTAIINNIIPATAGASAIDLTGYRTFAIQIVSTGTGGTFIFETSNDNLNFQTTPVVNQSLITGLTPVSAAITASVSQNIYTGPVVARYLRVRIVTAITGGSIQAFSKFSQVPYSPLSQVVSQGTASALNVAAVLGASGAAIGTVKPGAFGNSGQAIVTYTSASPVTTAAYTQVVAATTGTVILFKVFDSSGQAMIIASGAAGSEVPFAYIPPGGDNINFTVSAGTRISIKALTANATSGIFLLNMCN